MIRILTFTILGAFLGLLIACDDTPPTPPVTFMLDRVFPLALGQTGECRDLAGFTIRFDKIASDSRCPKGVECITAGQVEVVLTISKNGQPQTITLPFIIPNGTENVTEYQGHTIRIMGVSPMKFKDKPIDPTAYNIILQVMETPVGGPVAKLDQEFVLGFGESISLEGQEGYKIRFDSVSADSRCPEGVQCVWAGKADAIITFSQGTTSQAITLSTGDLSQGGNGQAAMGPYTLFLKAISPAKKKDAVIAPNAYKASLLIQK
ncbi:MAG TPA: hypothetical protein DCF33_01885 [Saprospirales bacterium]|nr:hypothetical protein [Saprospirales bacterium]